MDKIYVTQSSMPPLEEYIEEIKSIWNTYRLTNMGEKHKCLESQLREYLNVQEVSLFVNGHMALEMAIQAMGLEGEIITTPFTFVSTTHAIVRNNLTPVFCDINKDDFTIDVTKIEELITDKTSAILPIHVYGNICNVESIALLAKKYDLKVIYDAAHAFGEFYNGMGIGSFGDASMFSFHATKVFNTIEGGAICHSNKELGLQLQRLKNFGIRSETEIDSIGANAKMNEFQAAMGLCNLRHIDDEIIKRKKIVGQYMKNLEKVPGLILPKEQSGVESNYSYFPVLFEEKEFGATRNQVEESLKKHNIFPRKYFYPLTNSLSCFHKQFSVNNTPISLYISKRILTLPLFSDLKLEDVDKICYIILNTPN